MKATIQNSYLLLYTLALILILPDLSWAYGTLSGYVRDETGFPINGSKVTSTEGSTFITGVDGHYQMSHTPGIYAVTASAAGYADVTIDNVTAIDQQRTILDFSLPGAPLRVATVYPSLRELGQDLEVTITGTAFDTATRISIYPDISNKGKIIGSIDTPGRARGVTVNGSMAFVADGSSGLRIFDVTDPVNPAFIGAVDTPDRAYAVAVDGNTAYVADGSSGLQIIDVSDPGHPIPRDPVDTPGRAYAVKVVGGIAYIADGDRGLRIIDVTDPLNPSFLGSRDTPERAYDVMVDGSMAYVADGASGLQVINISNPQHPVIAGSVDTDGTASGVTVAGGIAYVADFDMGLQLINVSDPAHPTPIGSPVETFGHADALTVVGSTAYIAIGHSGLQLINVSDPGNPAVIGSVDTPGEANGVTVIGDTAYVADDERGGLQLVDVSNPANPTITGLKNTPGESHSVTVVGDTAYVADYDHGLQVIDISDPSDPVITGSVVPPGHAYDVVVVDNDNMAYIAGGREGLHMIDLTNLVNPIVTVEIPGSARALTVDGGIAYVAVADNDNGLQVVDVNPENLTTYLTVIGLASTPGSARGIALSADTAYLAYMELDDNDNLLSGLQLIDITNLSGPIVKVDTPGGANAVAVDGDIAYVADGKSGLQVIDVNPANPTTYLTVIGSVDTPNYAYDVAVVGNTAYIADGHNGLQVIDVSDPENPIIIGSMDTTGVSYGLTVEGNTAYIADGRKGFLSVPVPIEAASVIFDNDTKEITATLPGRQTAGNYILRAFNSTEHHQLPGAVTFGEINLLSSKAILVAGGGLQAVGGIWEETKAYANQAYESLLYQGYRYEDIIYLTAETGAPGRTGDATRAALEAAIIGAGTGDLLLYLVDHGKNERFLLEGAAEPVYVTASEIDSWLDILQSANPDGKTIVVYDGCRSGSFIFRLPPPLGEQRVVLTSSTPDQAAYFIDTNHSFSAHFWSTLSGKSGDRASLSDAFERAAANMASYQTAQLDANGNGVANEEEDFTTIEGLGGDIYALRRQYANPQRAKPVVAIVSANQTLNGASSAQLMARSVYDFDGDAIVQVWAEIVAPDSSPDPDLTVKNVATVELFDPEADGVYEAVSDDFTVEGTYIITYYARDAHGIYSLPKTSLVTQASGTANISPDAYEPDNSFAEAQIVVLNYPTPQYHTFHANGDTDWVRFYGIEGEVYTVKADNPALICDPAIRLYGADGTTLLASSNSGGPGVTEKLTGWTCPANGVYSVRLSNNSGYFGANVSYELKVYSPIAFSLPGYVSGRVTSSEGGGGIGGAALVAGGGSGLSQSNGSYIMSLESGSYNGSASKSGYQSGSFAVTVSSGGSTTKNITLTPTPNSVPVISGTPQTTLRANELFSFTPAVTDPDSGDLHSFSITGQPAWAAFSASLGRLEGVPAHSDIGSFGPVTITVTDSHGASASLAPFLLTVVQGDNQPPVIGGSPSTKIRAVELFSFTPSAHDPNGDTMTFSIIGLPAWAAFNSQNGGLYGVPGVVNIVAHGPVTISVTDSYGARSSLNPFTLNVLTDEEMDRLGTLPAVFSILLQEKEDEEGAR